MLILGCLRIVGMHDGLRMIPVVMIMNFGLAMLWCVGSKQGHRIGWSL